MQNAYCERAVLVFRGMDISTTVLTERSVKKIAILVEIMQRS